MAYLGSNIRLSSLASSVNANEKALRVQEDALETFKKGMPGQKAKIKFMEDGVASAKANLEKQKKQLADEMAAKKGGKKKTLRARRAKSRRSTVVRRRR